MLYLGMLVHFQLEAFIVLVLWRGVMAVLTVCFTVTLNVSRP